MKKFVTCYIVVLGFCLVSISYSTELVYRPYNPSFGGSPATGAYWLNSYQTQKKEEVEREERSSLDRFKQSLESRLVSQLLRDLEDNPDGGSVDTEDFTVNAQNTDGTLLVTIVDKNTGEVSTIEVENYYGL